LKFRYTAKTKTGELQTGVVNAANQAAALNILSGHGLFVLSLDKVAEEISLKKTFGIFRRVKRTDLMIFTRQISTLLGAKIPLTDSLKTLHRQTLSPMLRDAIYEISNDVDTGFSLSQSMSKHPDIFSEFYLNMVRSAEVTGKMEEVMNYLADYLEKEAGVATRVRNAMVYPIFVIVLFGGVGAFLVTVILPQLRPIFEEAGVELPLFTRMLMGSGDFLAKWWWAFIVGIAIAGVLLIDYLRTKEGRALMDELRVRAPVLGKLYRQLYVARFAESTSVLIRGGVPIAQAIEISGKTIGNVLYEDVLIEAAQAIRRGDLISTAISRYEKYFPPFTFQMVAVGETTGRLEELLRRVAEFYTREVDAMVSNLVELIQPLLIVFIGGAVGILFGSIILPIFKLAQGF